MSVTIMKSTKHMNIHNFSVLVYVQVATHKHHPRYYLLTPHFSIRNTGASGANLLILNSDSWLLTSTSSLQTGSHSSLLTSQCSLLLTFHSFLITLIPQFPLLHTFRFSVFTVDSLQFTSHASLIIFHIPHCLFITAYF